MLYEQENFLPQQYFEKYVNNYPEDWIREYCSNPEVSEHQSSLWGNFSAPIERYDEEFVNYIEFDTIPRLKELILGKNLEHDHFFVSFHMDDPGSFLETHNDLKDYRWLITSQIYLNDNIGVRIIKEDSEYEVPCIPNFLYSLHASPISFHYVPEIEKLKKSILFRVGKRAYNTVAHPKENEPAWIILNDHKLHPDHVNYHKDTHYAKLGLRMGNLTEAWLHNQGCNNIYHTKWRSDATKQIEKIKSMHSVVNVIQSGEFINTNETIQLTDDNINDYAEQMFNIDKYDTFFTKMEKNLREYWHKNLNMIYQDLD